MNDDDASRVKMLEGNFDDESLKPGATMHASTALLSWRAQSKKSLIKSLLHNTMRPYLCVGIAVLAFSSTPCTANGTGYYHSPVAAFLSVPTTTTTTTTSHQVLSFSLGANDNDNDNDTALPAEEEQDTVRVRIWRTLASGEELSLKQLGAAVGERRQGGLKAHLQHVEKQAKTLKNKNAEWRKRRGLPTANVKRINKLRIKTRLGNKNEVYIRLG